MMEPASKLSHGRASSRMGKLNKRVKEPNGNNPCHLFFRNIPDAMSPVECQTDSKYERYAYRTLRLQDARNGLSDSAVEARFD